MGWPLDLSFLNHRKEKEGWHSAGLLYSVVWRRSRCDKSGSYYGYSLTKNKHWLILWFQLFRTAKNKQVFLKVSFSQGFNNQLLFIIIRIACFQVVYKTTLASSLTSFTLFRYNRVYMWHDERPGGAAGPFYWYAYQRRPPLHLRRQPSQVFCYFTT